MTHNAWNPELYLRFEQERSRPPLDLVSQVKLDNPATIIDLGCGPGNSTAPLWKRWPQAEVVGLDQSPSMIEEAKRRYPQNTWVVGDVQELAATQRFDLVFACASLQWIPDHRALLPRLLGHLTEQGALAVQIPQYHRMEVSSIVEESFASVAGTQAAGEASSQLTFHSPSFYDGQLRPRVSRLELWETSYIHLMPDHHSILEMVRSTGLRPFLSRLSEDSDRARFEERILTGLQKAYPTSPTGGVLFPFLRFFFVAYR